MFTGSSHFPVGLKLNCVLDLLFHIKFIRHPHYRVSWTMISVDRRK